MTAPKPLSPDDAFAAVVGDICDRLGGDAEDTMNDIPAHRRAPEGYVWQCLHCDKRAEERYGIIGWSDRGYDVSCALNSVPVPLEPDEAPEPELTEAEERALARETAADRRYHEQAERGEV